MILFLIVSFILIAVLAKNASSLVDIYPSIAHKDHEKGIYLVEFPIGHVATRESISAHLESKSYDRNNVKIRTNTETDLFHGHSFFLDQDHDEVHIASIPGAIKVYRVKTIYRSSTVSSEERVAFSTKMSTVVHSVSEEKTIDKMSATISTEAIVMKTLAAVSTIKADDVHLLTGVHDARSKLGLKGKGIKIAVIDSGVYYNHPALGGCFGPGCKISFGYDLVGDNFNPPSNSVLAPDPYPFDNCSGFSIGTMAMGIIMGNATGLKDGGFDFTGVAPEATVGMYRVFGCNGGSYSTSSTSSDIVLSAILMATQADAYIISLAISGALTYSDDPIAVAASRASAAGHIVVFTAGDSGDIGLFTSNKFANETSVFSVATFYNSYDYADGNIKVNGAQFPFQNGNLNASFSFPDTLNIVINNLTAYPSSTNDACDLATIKQATASGQTLLIYFRRYFNLCGSFKSCTNAAKKGYTRCLIYASTDEYFSISGTDLIPSGIITPSAGLAIVAAIKSGNKPTVIVDKIPMLFPLKKAGTVAYFSGAGLDYELNIQPDFGVIGAPLFTTINPSTQNSLLLPSPYATLNQYATSAYASGCIALLLQAHGGGKSLNFNQIKTLIQNSAKPANLYGSSPTMIDSVANQGAGLINIYDAIVSKTNVYPSNLALNDTQYTKTSYELKITNNDAISVVYNLASVGAATAYPLRAGDDVIQTKLNTKYTAEYAQEVKFKKSDGSVVKSVTVPAGSTATIKVEFKPPATAVASLFPIYSGYISISSSNSVESAKVPYAGMLGKFSDFPIWSRQSASFSNNFLLDATTGLFNITTSAPIASNAIISSTTGINILPIFETGTRYYKVEVLSGKGPNYVTVGYPLVTVDGSSLALQGANQPKNDYIFFLPTLYAWNGDVCKFKNCTTGKKLSPGYYRIKFSALKHFAPVNSKLDSDYDIVITPAFVLDTTAAPSVVPTYTPSIIPTRAPSVVPTRRPSVVPTRKPSIVPSRRPSVVPSTIWPSKKPVRVPTYKPKEKEQKESPSSKHSSTTGLQSSSSSSVDGSTIDVATIAGVSVAVSVLLLLVIAYFCYYRNKIASRINSEMLESSTLGQDDIRMEDMFSPEESEDEGKESFSQINHISK